MRCVHAAIDAWRKRMNVEWNQLHHRYRFGIVGYSLGAAVALHWLSSLIPSSSPACHRDINSLNTDNVTSSSAKVKSVMTFGGEYHCGLSRDEFPLDRLILISAFTSLTTLSQHYVGPCPSWCWSALGHEAWNNEIQLRALLSHQLHTYRTFMTSSSVRVLPLSLTILHGTHDDLIPISMGHRLMSIANRWLRVYQVESEILTIQKLESSPATTPTHLSNLSTLPPATTVPHHQHQQLRPQSLIDDDNDNDDESMSLSEALALAPPVSSQTLPPTNHIINFNQSRPSPTSPTPSSAADNALKVKFITCRGMNHTNILTHGKIEIWQAMTT
jgi:hypothetical protein